MNFKPLYIHIPAHLLAGRMTFLINRKLQPEVACQETPIDKLDFELIADCAQQLREHGLSTTLHAPYNGFYPGSSKKRIRKFSHSLAEKSLQLAEKLMARRIVFHPGLSYGSGAKEQQLWLENCADFWPEFIARAKTIDTLICIENIYETTPEIFIRLLNELDSPHIGHVFDIGHWNMFGTTRLLDWLQHTAPYLRHLHLHDNHGERDEHLAIGRGYVPFSELFDWLKKTSPSELTMTVENHSLPNTELSLTSIYQHFPQLKA